VRGPATSDTTGDHGAGVDADEACDGAQHRRLAAAARADHGQQLAPPHVQADAVERDHGAEALADLVQGQHLIDGCCVVVMAYPPELDCPDLQRTAEQHHDRHHGHGDDGQRRKPASSQRDSLASS
jgi:hypothetical protein